MKQTKKRQAPKGTKAAVKTGHKFMDDLRLRIQGELDRQHMSLRAIGRKAELGNSTVRNLMKISQDVSVGTLIKIAETLGVPPPWLTFGVHGFYESNDPIAVGILILKIFGSHEAEATQPAVNLGVIAVEKSKYPADARAMLVEDKAMVLDRVNAPVSPEQIVLDGDAVVWARSIAGKPGELVVAKMRGGYVVRRLAEGAGGGFVLQPNSASFSTTDVTMKEICGRVLAVHRRLER